MPGTVSAEQDITVTNTTANALNIGSTTLTGIGAQYFSLAPSSDCGTTLNANSSCNIGITYAPAAGTSGFSLATLSITDSFSGANAYSGTQTVPLTGNITAPGPVVVLNPSSLSYTTALGSTSTAQTVTVSNTGTLPLAIANYGIIDPTGSFSVTGTPSCPATLAAGGSCTIGITFTPSSSTPIQATLSITDNAPGSPHVVTLTGGPPAPLAVLTPSSLPFPDQVVGTTSAPQLVVLSNPGTAVLNIASINITGPNASIFVLNRTACGATLAVNASCNLFVSSAPAGGRGNALLTVTDDAAGSPQTVTLTVNGVAPNAVFTPTGLTFNTQIGTTSAAQTITLSNPTNTAGNPAPLTLGGITLTGANASQFAITASTCGTSVAANGGSCTISVTFTPTSSSTASASLSVVDNSYLGSPQTIPLTGTGTVAASAPQVVFTPGTLAFPSTAVGATATAQTITLSNPGNATLNISGITVTGAKAAFPETTTCGATLAAGANCTFSITFMPASAGSFAASISVADNASGSPQTVALTGTAAASGPQAVLSTATLAFPSTTVGATSAAQTITLSNSGNAALNIATGGITVTGASPADFAETTTCGTTLAAGANCTISVTFKPASAVSFAASISVADNASGSPQTVALTGIGTAAGGPASATFTVNAATLSQSVSSGAVAQFNIAVSSTGGVFNTAVTLSATGLPAGATVSFAPASVTPGSAGGASVMSIQTASLLAASAAPVGDTHRQRSLPLLAALAGLPLLGMMRLQRRYRKTTQRLMLLALAALSLLPFLALSGCGGGLFGATPHTSLITVTGTSGSLQQSATVSLTVQ
jgi:hypothetical protein